MKTKQKGNKHSVKQIRNKTANRYANSYKSKTKKRNNMYGGTNPGDGTPPYQGPSTRPLYLHNNSDNTSDNINANTAISIKIEKIISVLEAKNSDIKKTIDQLENEKDKIPEKKYVFLKNKNRERDINLLNQKIFLKEIDLVEISYAINCLDWLQKISSILAHIKTELKQKKLASPIKVLFYIIGVLKRGPAKNDDEELNAKILAYLYIAIKTYENILNINDNLDNIDYFQLASPYSIFDNMEALPRFIYRLKNLDDKKYKDIDILNSKLYKSIVDNESEA